MTQLIRSLNKTLLVRCEQTLVRGHQCFCFASGACDFCMLPLCHDHKAKRMEYGALRNHEHIFCANCAATYDYQQERLKQSS